MLRSPRIRPDKRSRVCNVHLLDRRPILFATLMYDMLNLKPLFSWLQWRKLCTVSACLSAFNSNCITRKKIVKNISHTQSFGFSLLASVFWLQSSGFRLQLNSVTQGLNSALIKDIPRWLKSVNDKKPAGSFFFIELLLFNEFGRTSTTLKLESLKAQKSLSVPHP